MSPSHGVHDASLVLVGLGTAVLVASCVGALFAKNTYHRLHFATPITSLGGPLIAIGFAVENGPNLTTASILLPTALIFLASPVLSSAIARTIAQNEGRVDSESPQ